MLISFKEWVKVKQAQIETVLDALLPVKLIPHTLHQAMRYAALDGGKRIRPMLVFAAGELVDAPIATIEKIAAAIELIHVYSLVHDDLPAMDNDILRRGRATTHIQYGEANAILVGDALQTRAFEILSAPGLCHSATQQLALIQCLSQASGASGMCGGQVIDLEAEEKELTLAELEMMHIMKTGALIRASVLMGSQCGKNLSPLDQQKLTQFAQCVGLAFQIIDDILDAEGNTTGLGKTAGKDQKSAKSTYVSLLGISEAKRKAHELYDTAMSAIKHFDQQAHHLSELANFIIERHY